MNTNRLATREAVIAWFAERYPDQIPNLEAERDWLWLIGDLRGDKHRELREAIGSKDGIGFRFAPEGHELPSGNLSHWAHNCGHPTRVQRTGQRLSNHADRPGKPDTRDDCEDVLAALEALA